MAKAKEANKPIGLVKLDGARCRCGWEWLPRVNEQSGERERPSVCPRCKSPRWDRAKLYERAR